MLDSTLGQLRTIPTLSLALTLTILSSFATSSTFPQTSQISSTTLTNLQYYSQFSAAAYCSSNTDPTLILHDQPLLCAANTCPAIQSSPALYLSSISNQGIFSLTSFLAHDVSRDTLVLSFRGAEGLGVLTQIPATFTPCTIFCANCTCWTGFYSAWLEIRDQIVRDLEEAVAKLPGRDLIVTGHSLGAILAVYAAGELRANASTSTSTSTTTRTHPLFPASKISLYTYGQPRSGNLALASTLSTTLRGAGNFRVTHTDDPAPRMGDIDAGFRHMSPEYWIREDKSLQTFEAGVNQVSVVDGYDSLEGNGGTGGYDVPAHVEYFQAQLGGCNANTSRILGLPYWLGGTVGGVVNGTFAG